MAGEADVSRKLTQKLIVAQRAEHGRLIGEGQRA